MRKLLLMLLASFVFVLGACAETEEKEVDSLESSEKDSEDASEDEEDEGTEEETKELDQTLVDNDNLKVIVTGINKIVDKEWDEERYEISIEIDNKREDTIEVQAYEVSADGNMIDDMVDLSETVAGGKHSDAIMYIENYEGDLPEMEKNLEFTLDVFDDDFEYEEQHDVKIEF